MGAGRRVGPFFDFAMTEQHQHGATPATMPWTGRLGALRGTIGAGLAIALTGLVTHLVVGADPAAPWLVASMGASAVLAFVLPASPLAQPWPVIGSHVLAAAIGLACHLLPLPPWLCAGLAVAGSIAAMSLLRCLHPPAGGTAVLLALATPAVAAQGWHFLILPLGLNVVLLTLLAVIYNRLTGHAYPHHAPHIAMPPVLAGRYTLDDLDAVLEDWDEVLSIDRDELDALFRAVETRVAARG